MSCGKHGKDGPADERSPGRVAVSRNSKIAVPARRRGQRKIVVFPRESGDYEVAQARRRGREMERVFSRFFPFFSRFYAVIYSFYVRFFGCFRTFCRERARIPRCCLEATEKLFEDEVSPVFQRQPLFF